MSVVVVAVAVLINTIKNKLEGIKRCIQFGSCTRLNIIDRQEKQSTQHVKIVVPPKKYKIYLKLKRFIDNTSKKGFNFIFFVSFYTLQIFL